MTHRNNKGERRVDLFLPFEARGKVVEHITFQPVEFGTLLRWEAGEIPGIMALMSEISGMAQEDLYFLKYPDAQFVMDEFMLHLPETIRQSIAEGRIPTPPPLPRPVQQPRPDDSIYTHPPLNNTPEDRPEPLSHDEDRNPYADQDMGLDNGGFGND